MVLALSRRANGARKIQSHARLRCEPESTGLAKPKKNKGRVKRDAQALQYCVQKHDATLLHHDFRLEHKEYLEELVDSEKAVPGSDGEMTDADETWQEKGRVRLYNVVINAA